MNSNHNHITRNLEFGWGGGLWVGWDVGGYEDQALNILTFTPEKTQRPDARAFVQEATDMTVICTVS